MLKARILARPTMNYVGREVRLKFDVKSKKGQPRTLELRTVFIQMGIKAPNGDTCFIFGKKSIYAPSSEYTHTKVGLVKAFMRQHDGWRR